ncbi:MAG: hypothetical protein ACK56F_30975, partial [bacterium]
MTVGTKGCIQTSSICAPHACAVMPWGGGGDCTLSLAWDGAVMMPLQLQDKTYCYVYCGRVPVPNINLTNCS